jgi:hypothetical protein
LEFSSQMTLVPQIAPRERGTLISPFINICLQEYGVVTKRPHASPSQIRCPSLILWQIMYKITKIKKIGEEKAIMGHRSIEHLKEFSSEKRIRKKLSGSEKLVVDSHATSPDRALHSTLIQGSI